MGRPLRIALPRANAFLITILERMFVFVFSFLPKAIPANLYQGFSICLILAFWDSFSFLELTRTFLSFSVNSMTIQSLAQKREILSWLFPFTESFTYMLANCGKQNLLE